MAGAAWFYPRERFYGEEHALADRHDPLRAANGAAPDDRIEAGRA